MRSLVFCCALCACAAPVPAQDLLIENGFYRSTTLSGDSILMTGGHVELSSLRALQSTITFTGGVIANSDVVAAESMLMTGGRADGLRFRSSNLTITGGTITDLSVGAPHLVVTGGEISSLTQSQAGTFEFFGGRLMNRIHCSENDCDVIFHGNGFRSFKSTGRNPIYTVEGLLRDKQFFSMTLSAANGDARAEATPTFVFDDSGPLPGDTDGDFVIDLADLNIVRNNFGLQVASRTAGDLDSDGSVGLSDLNEIRNNFGAFTNFTLGPEYQVPSTPVPEPSTMALLATCALAGIPLRRRCRSWLRRSP